MSAKQTKAQRLADAIDPFVRKSAPDHLTSKVAADFMLRQDELLGQALEALERGETKIRFAAITAIRAHREAK